jgi:hypothetical protein
MTEEDKMTIERISAHLQNNDAEWLNQNGEEIAHLALDLNRTLECVRMSLETATKALNDIQRADYIVREFKGLPQLIARPPYDCMRDMGKIARDAIDKIYPTIQGVSNEQ